MKEIQAEFMFHEDEKEGEWYIEFAGCLQVHKLLKVQESEL